MVTIDVWPHMLSKPEASMGTMFLSIRIAIETVETLAKLFKGETKYVGDGSESVQFDSRVVIADLSLENEQLLLTAYPFITIKR